MSVGKRAENGKGQYHLYAIVTHTRLLIGEVAM